jgi:hypothetical protein
VRAGGLRVTANVDTSPQPYARLERTIVESSQQFSAVELVQPQPVARLGLDAAWFGDTGAVMTADAKRLLTVTVDWRGAPASRRRGLAIAVARAYLASAPGSRG